MSYRILALIKISMLFLSFGVLAYDPLVEETLQSPQIKHVMDFLKENGYQSKPEIFIETYNAEVNQRSNLNEVNDLNELGSSSVSYSGGRFTFYNYQNEDNYILVDPELNVTHMQLSLNGSQTDELFSGLPSLRYLAIDASNTDGEVVNIKNNHKIKEVFLKDGVLTDLVLPESGLVEMIGTSLGKFEKISNLGYQRKLLSLRINNDVNNLSDINDSSSLEFLTVMSKGKLNFELLSLKNLKYLTLYGDTKRDISNISKLSNLRGVVLGNGIYVGGVKLPVLLEWLRFGGKENDQMPNFSNSSNLKKMFISRVSFDETKGLDGLNNLEELTILGTPLKKISGLDSLTKLKKLRIERSNIKKVENISHLSALEYLVLVSNKINAVGKLDGLNSIKEIELQRNNLNYVDLSKFNAVKGCKVFLGSNPFFDNSEGEMRRKLISLAKYGA
ncbi:hypothetical protein [Photobacterium kagoshimensis]|uniref:hypothetical protein n=1 Tax=Photobacterium kagoshimensis TaxID=2910242 RepID=UPI003D14BB85